MHFRKKANKAPATISSPKNIVHLGHVSHDEITQRLLGLPDEWVTILREKGYIDEYMVFPRKSRIGGLYGDGVLGSRSLSLLSNRSSQEISKDASGKRGDGSVDEKSVELGISEAIVDGNNDAEQVVRAANPRDSSSSLQDLNAFDVQRPASNRQSISSMQSQQWDDVDQLAKDCGLTFRHHEYHDIEHSLFEVVDALGHGSLGVVEEVRISPQHRSFVRKRVQIPQYRRKQYLDIITQEAQILQDLSHCHIVKMIGSYSEIPGTGRQYYSLLMAPVGHRDLKIFLDMVGDHSTTQSADWIEVRRAWLRSWFTCLSSALAYMHSKGVRHQDIKPSNIIHRKGTVYFTDFSSASQFQIGQTTSTENPARTSAMYAAPEVVDNEDRLNRHGLGTDIWALGAVFTEMLAVVRGKSIEEYHRFLRDGVTEKPNGRPTADRQPFLYGQKTREIDAFFQDDEFYQTCIKSMLIADRALRPDAKQVASRIRGFEPWPQRACACDLEEIG